MYETALDLMSESLVITDNHLQIQYVNEACEELFGFSREEITGRHLHEVFSDVKNEHQITRLTADRKENMRMRFLPLCWKGQDLVLSVYTKRKENERGELEFIVTRIKDVTKDYEWKRSLQERIKQLSTQVIYLEEGTGVLPLHDLGEEVRYEVLLTHIVEQCRKLDLSLLVIDLSAIPHFNNEEMRWAFFELLQTLKLLGIEVRLSGFRPSAVLDLRQGSKELLAYPSYRHLKGALAAGE